MARISIADVAARAGVSKGSVSFVLNNRPGVSLETRERVLRAAQDLGWRPHAAAKALADGRTDSIGLIMNRPPGIRGVDPLLQHFLEGVQDELVDHSISLLIKVVSGHEAELATQQEWARGGRVDGLVVIDARVDDDRPAALRSLGLPCVFLGSPAVLGDVPTVWVDDDAAAREIVEHLVELGHRRIARVAGSDRLAHSVVRTRCLARACEKAQIDPLLVTVCHSSDASAVTRDLLNAPVPPTAIVYENDVQAMASLGAAAALGWRVPRSLSVVAWDESGLSTLTDPTLTAVKHDARDQGARAVRLLLDRIEGRDTGCVEVRRPCLSVRRSTARVAQARQPSRNDTPNPPRG